MGVRTLKHEFSGLVKADRDGFAVSLSAYNDERVYRAELENIFYSTWIYLGHVSEIKDAGSYKSTRIGERPVFIIRDSAGKIRAFLNACTHRGAALCREEYGSAKTIVCPYHNWSFKPNGELIGVPDRERYPAAFSTKDYGLTPLPRLAEYGGLIFGSFNPDVPPLEEFLGLAKRYIDLWLKRAVDGEFTVGQANKYSYSGNWKLHSENVVDGYHPHIVHRATFGMLKKYQGTAGREIFDRATPHSEGLTRALPGGHGTLEAATFFESAFVPAKISQAYIDRVRELNGDEAPDILSNRHLLIFPNLVLMDHVMRTWYPLAAGRTEIFSYVLRNSAIDPVVDQGRLYDQQMLYSWSGTVSPDDADMFAACQTGAHSGPDKMIPFMRGLGMEQVRDSGERIGGYSDETPQRSFWSQWTRMMGASPVVDRRVMLAENAA